MPNIVTFLKQHVFTCLILLGLLLVLPSVWTGLFADDFFHRMLVQNTLSHPPSASWFAFHLFSFLDNNPLQRQHLLGLSILPWWASPDLTINFFRPLSELTHVLDYRFIYPHLWLMHLHSLLWFGLLLLLLAQFYRNFSASHFSAVWAMLFFVVDASHGMTVTWLANRNAVIAAVFSLLAINAHHAFRSKGEWRYYLLSVLAIMACFAAAEAGVVVGVLLLAYALFLDKAGIFKGLLYLLPALLVFLGWLGLYQHYGFGASGHTFYYIDPVQSPVQFLQVFPERFLQALSIQFNILPLNFFPEFNGWVVAAGGVFLVLLMLPLFHKKMAHLPNYRFFCFSLLLAIVPSTATEIQDRTLLYVGILGAPLLAELLLWCSRLSNRALRYAGIGVLVFFHVFLSALLLPVICYFPKALTEDLVTSSHSLPTSHQHIISLGTHFPHASFVTSIRSTHGLPIPQHLWNLTTSLSGVSLQRTGSHHFIVKSHDGLFGTYDLKLRNLEFNPITVGERFNLNGLEMTITAINSAGFPVAAEVEVDSQIPASDIGLASWEEHGRDIHYTAFTLAVGETKTF